MRPRLPPDLPPDAVNSPSEAKAPLETARSGAARQGPEAADLFGSGSASGLGQADELPQCDQETVYDTLCLAGMPCSSDWLLAFLRQLQRNTSAGVAFTRTDLKQMLATLVAGRRVAINHAHLHEVPAADLHRALPRVLMAAGEPAWQAWARASASHVAPGGPVPPPRYTRREELPALARLLLYSGCSVDTFEQTRLRVLGPAREPEVLVQALCQPFMPTLWAQAQPALRHTVLQLLMRSYHLAGAFYQPVLRALQHEVQQQRDQMPPLLRLVSAENNLMAGDTRAAAHALEGLHGHAVLQLKAALQARQGQWPAAMEAFRTGLKTAAEVLHAKRGLAPPRVLQWYVLSLLAQPDPKLWAWACKFCVQESGTRTPRVEDGWGLWAHAIAVRLGDTPLQRQAFHGPRHSWEQSSFETHAHRLVLSAWLGEQPAGWTDATLSTTRALLLAEGLGSLAVLAGVAARRLDLPWPADDPFLEEPPAHALETAAPAHPAQHPPHDAAWAESFFGTPREAWRDALAAIEALGESSAKAAPQAGSSLLQWHLALDAQGRVDSIVPFEQTVGVRGPGRRKAVPLSRLKKADSLDPRDAAVARCINAVSWAPGKLRLDTVGAAVALVGHPQLVLADAPEQPVDLREGLPQLEVRRQRLSDGSERFVFHLLDPLTSTRSDDDDRGEGASGDSEPDAPEPEHLASRSGSPETERRNNLRVLRDAPDRARLIRVSPAQRRVAELVAKQWSVPVEAQDQLDGALRVLAGHFQLHSDATAGQEVASECRLRALLSPLGAGLQLRLVVQPFGSFGPAVLPGLGRPRLLTVNDGLNLATQRDLGAERLQLNSVLQALPQLAGTESGDCTWALTEPEEALAVLEQLPRLSAVCSVDWPRGKPVRIQAVATEQLQVQVRSGADWLGLHGDLPLEEGRVISLQQLLHLAHESRRSRFLALGDGAYLALTEQLRRQLAELKALAQADGDTLKLPLAASNWLADTLANTQLSGDPAWTQRVQHLADSAGLQPEVPTSLQAQLRAYQAEGYAWMARLAHAGLGACLADDMGLGKTVQTLALLLHRAALGPALVLAPTSVCGNWLAETLRFAPSLQVAVYGAADGDRQAVLGSAAAGQVVIASYALSQIDSEAFAAVPWATVVMDEAQALKNAATKRAKSAASLQAGFRLALTGTPVENRLADLWSIMNLTNPGLLGTASRFAERFAGPIERDGDEAARQRLRRICSPFLLRRTKAQVLSDLPPRTEIVHLVEPGPEERAFLEAARRAALQRVAQAADAPPGQAAFHVLAELTRLRRAACDPRLVAPELGLIGAKAHEFEQLAIELVAGRHKALVFSQFTDFLKLLGQRLQAAGLSHQYLDGSTPAAQRSERVAAFQRGEGDLFLISLKAGGFGLNLTAADYVIIVDPWWNPAAEDQALGRAHRIGQHRPVTVYRLVTAGSVEEKIIALHGSKRSLADGILEGQDQGLPLGADELTALLRDG